MATTIEKHGSKWRNFASWSAAGGLIFIVVVGVASWLGNGDDLDRFLASGTVDPRLALAFLFSAAVLGLSSLNIPFGWRSLRNFLVLSAAAGGIAALVLGGLLPLVDAGTFGTMGASQWAAAGVGLALLFFAAVICIILATSRRGWTLLDAEQAETLNERPRLLFLSWISMAAMGLILILLGLAGPGSVLAAEAALAGALVLCAVVILLSFSVWRLMDELDRTMSYESGTMAFYLILLFGGGWAMLAHLQFVTPAAPLDWLTMLTLITFAASLIAAGRRGLLKSR